jgi:protoporphyrinogen oxidase
MSKNFVTIIGGGISGLACSLCLNKVASASGISRGIVLLESSDRVGGQIKTVQQNLGNGIGSVILEAGAEGFIARSVVFPRLAHLADISAEDIVNQKRVADCELSWNGHVEVWDINELEPGVAAQKLGFQVKKSDRGLGIRSFSAGMGQLVDAISSRIDTRLQCHVDSIEFRDNTFFVNTSGVTGQEIIRSENLVLATPVDVVNSLLSKIHTDLDFKRPSRNSHVSVHILTSTEGLKKRPSSFTVPQEVQDRFHGLRACSLINEKFPGRCSDNHFLFRFYFRPSETDRIGDRDLWVGRAKSVLDDVFGVRTPIVWTHFAPWVSALPVFTERYILECNNFKRHVASRFEDRLYLIGAEFNGAGLDAAARSGVEAAEILLSQT